MCESIKTEKEQQLITVDSQLESSGFETSCTICVCQNKKSKKYFIVIDSYQDDNMQLVTPKGEILVLDGTLFTEPDDIYEYLLTNSELLSNEQLDSYYRYIDEQEVVVSENHSEPNSKYSGAEPQYLKTYRSMLSNAKSMPSIMLAAVEKSKIIRWYELVEQLTEHGYVGRGGSLTASLKVLEVDGYLQVEGTGNGKFIRHVRGLEKPGTDKTNEKTIKQLEKLLQRMSKEQKEAFLEKLIQS